MPLCSMCKKHVAIVYTTRIENGKKIDEGYCIKCAYKVSLPGIGEYIKSSGINDSNIDEIAESFDRSMEEIGDMNIEDYFKNILSSMSGDSEFFDEYEEFDSEDYDDEDLENIEGNDPSNSSDDNTEDDGLKKGAFRNIFKGSRKSSKSKNKNKNNAFKNLSEFGTNLTERAANGKIDRVIGRDKEINRVIQILNRRSKNNPVLIGAPGVGKTAVAQGLALKIVNGEVPEKILDMQVWQLDLPAMVAGTQFRGQFEARIKGVINEAIRAGNVILVIDELHMIMGAGDTQEGATNAANILKPALARGELKIIGSTTTKEYKKIEHDSALDRRFQKVMLDEPSIEDAIDILKGIKDYYEEHHYVTYDDEVLEFAVKASKRYITDRYLPDKAIDLIDEAGSRANLKNIKLVKIATTKKKLEQANAVATKLEGDWEEISSKEDAKAKEDYYKEVSDNKMLISKLESELEALQTDNIPDPIQIEDIARVVEMWTGIPCKSISEDENEKLRNLESRLHERVIGQKEAVSAVSAAVRRTRSGFAKKNKPVSFLFVGPTGVGKTELVKALAEVMFNTEDSLIRIDMSEYMEQYSVSKLIGSPPGYVGYEESGQLTEQVRRKPYSVVLFDEIEKAHADVYNLLLQLLDEGRLTDSHGLLVNFENTIIIMTSNVGNTAKAATIGFNNDTDEAKNSSINSALKNTFRPEFLNRIDETIIFTELSNSEIEQICSIMLKEVNLQLEAKGVKLKVSKKAIKQLASIGYDPKFGARPLRREIRRNIEDKLTDLYLDGKLQNANLVTIDYKSNKFTFDITYNED